MEGAKIAVSGSFRVIIATLAQLFLLFGFTLGPDSSTYYSVRHPDEFKTNWKAFYDKIDRMTLQVRTELPNHLDIPYDKDPKQKLDLYLPAHKIASAPVLVFLHGGAFSEGDRSHYGYVARPFATHDIITVVPSYRLTPRFRFPAQPEDIEHVVLWVYNNVKQFGGDPNRIYIVGHSAGAILASFVSNKPDWLRRRSLPLNLIRGCVAISANYDLRTTSSLSLRRTPMQNNYAPTPKLQRRASPILRIKKPPPKTVIALGSLEESRLLPQSQEFASKIKEKGAEVDLIIVNDVDHDGIVISLGDETSSLTQAILRMIAPH